MGGCYSCDESQQITWICGSFHHQLQISIKTERGERRTVVAIILHSDLSPLPSSLPPHSQHPPLTLTAALQCFELLCLNSYWFLYYVELISIMADPTQLSHHSYLLKYFSNHFPKQELKPETSCDSRVFIIWYSVNSLLLRTINCYNNSPPIAW